LYKIPTNKGANSYQFNFSPNRELVLMMMMTSFPTICCYRCLWGCCTV